MISPFTYKSDDGGFTVEEEILHDVIARGIRAGLVSARTPTNIAIRLLDRAGAIAKQDRELLIEVYPEMFQPASQVKAAEILFPQLEI